MFVRTTLWLSMRTGVLHMVAFQVLDDMLFLQCRCCCNLMDFLFGMTGDRKMLFLRYGLLQFLKRFRKSGMV